MTTSTDDRAEIVRRANAGESERAIARAFGISRSAVWDIKQAAKRAAKSQEVAS